MTTKPTDLKELGVLMNEEDFRIIYTLKSQKDLTEADLSLVGDIILSSLRCYC